MATEAPISIFMQQLHQPRSRPNSMLLSPSTAYGPTQRGGILLNARNSLLLGSGYSSGVNTPRSPSPSPAQLHQPRSRPNSMLLSPSTAYGPTQRGGILLNARNSLLLGSGYSSGVNTPRSPSPSPAVLRPDAAGMDRSQVSSGSRKIRFAPLPEPRREVAVDDDGTEIPCAATYPADATAFPVQSPASTSVTLDRTDSLVTDSGASTNSTDETQSQKSSKRSKRNSLLRLVGLGSSSSLSKRPSTASLPTSDSGLFSTVFRTTSRESSSGEPSGYTSDNSVARRMSSPLRPSSAGGHAATYPADATAFPVQSPASTSVTLDRTDSLVTDSGASTNSTDETQSQKSSKHSKRNSLLRLVGLGSSSSLSKRPSTASLPTSDSGLFSTVFRTTSRESSSGEPSGYTSDNSVARRMSSPLRPSSAGGRPSSGYASFGAPLAHSVSEGTGTRPQRMLNGRVYGARRARERLQPLPSMEPQFSEWGYGGMGSVGQGSEYSKLQSKTSSLGGPAGNDDEDDGSGLTWVRKRKEKKEREEREKKEAEEAAAKAAQAEAEAASSPPRTSTETAGSSTTVHAERSETPTAPQTPTGTAAAMSPPRPRMISSPPSRQNSTATVTPDRHHPTVVAVPAHRGRHEASVLNSGVLASPETSPERSSGSSRRSSSSDDEDTEDSTGREEEEEEEENQKRRTALSAGVEKISRHH
ncbi:hypothetical protein RSAG8_02010, partial [Rhizoctonia solani AG-8 WAC10335]